MPPPGLDRLDLFVLLNKIATVSLKEITATVLTKVTKKKKKDGTKINSSTFYMLGAVVSWGGQQTFVSSADEC